MSRPFLGPVSANRSRSHLDGVDQVLDQEQAPQLPDDLVEFGQNHVAVLVHHVLRQRHLLVQVLPERSSRGAGSILSRGGDDGTNMCMYNLSVVMSHTQDTHNGVHDMILKTHLKLILSHFQIFAHVCLTSLTQIRLLLCSFHSSLKF